MSKFIGKDVVDRRDARIAELEVKLAAQSKDAAVGRAIANLPAGWYLRNLGHAWVVFRANGEFDTPSYASENFLETLTEQVAALRKMQAELTNRQCVAEMFLEAALSGNSYDNAATWLRDVANYTSIYSSYTGMLRKMADVLARAAKEQAE